MEWGLFALTLMKVTRNSFVKRLTNDNNNAVNVTLVGGQGGHEGNVFINGMPVCHYSWDLKDAWVVCKQLGFASVVSATTGSQFGKVPKDSIMNYVQCTGEEPSLLNCSHSRYDNCYEYTGAGVICSFDHIGNININLPYLQ